MKLIVIGHGMVGHKFLETLFADGVASAGMDVTVLCEEPRPAYDRVHLSSYFSGTSADELSLVADGFFERDNVDLRLNAKAAHIDRAARTVTLESGEVLGYDKLVFATGSYPFVPPVPGKERADVFVYRTIEDLEKMLECGARSKSGVVVGGGLLGLECAKALRDMSLDTHVVEFAPRLMAVQVDDLGGRMLRTKIEELGVNVHTQKNTLQIVDGEKATHRMEHRHQRRLPDLGPVHLRDRRMRRLERPDLRPGRPRLRHGAHGRQGPAGPGRHLRRRRHEHQAEADGRGRGLDR
jgi:nitrite reductase (NADH) large subunit